MTSYKSIHKPRLINPAILNLLKAPANPHYKIYIKLKLSNLPWKDRKILTKYLVSNYVNNQDKYQYISNRYYHGIKYLTNYIFNNYAWEGTDQVMPKEKLEFDKDQIFFTVSPISFIVI